MNEAYGPVLSSVLRALHGTDISLFYQDRELKYLWLENPPTGWKESDLIGKTDYEVLPAAAAEVLIPAKLEVLRTGEDKNLEVPVEAHGEERWYEVWLEADRGQDHEIAGLLFFVVDITEKIERERNLQNLLKEVSHRSRNLLAIVQSIANQTARSNLPADTFLLRFNERVQSLAFSLDAVTTSGWDGATLHDLILRQSRPFLINGAGIKITGLNPILDANASLHLGLAIQELSSRAAQNGAWSLERGGVDVDIKILNERDPDAGFVLTWTEQLPRDSNWNDIDRFSHLTVQKLVPMAVGGEANLSVDDRGTLAYHLTVPAGNFR